MDALELLAELAGASLIPPRSSSSSTAHTSSSSSSTPAAAVSRKCTFQVIPRVQRASPARIEQVRDASVKAGGARPLMHPQAGKGGVDMVAHGLGTPDVNKAMRKGSVTTPPSALSLARSGATSASLMLPIRGSSLAGKSSPQSSSSASSALGSKPVGRLVCHVCKYSTNHTSHMRRHMRAHAGDKPYACQKCSYRCAQRANLKRHFRSRHTGEKPFFCPFCDYKSAQKSHIQGHIRSRHPSEDPTSVIVQPPVVATAVAADTEKQTTITIPAAAAGVAAEVSTARSCLKQKKRKAALNLLDAGTKKAKTAKMAAARASPTGVQDPLA